MADTTVTNLNEGKSNLITRTSNAITDIRRILNEPAAKRALPTALALIVTFVGIILFISLKFVLYAFLLIANLVETFIISSISIICQTPTLNSAVIFSISLILKIFCNSLLLVKPEIKIIGDNFEKKSLL